MDFSVAGDFMSGLGSLGGGIASTLGSGASRRHSKSQYNHQVWLGQHAVQLKMEDLQRSGLNPLLAVSNGVQGSSFPNYASTPDFDYGKGIGNAAQNIMNLMSQKAQIASMNANTAKTIQEVDAAKTALELEKLRNEYKIQWILDNSDIYKDYIGSGVAKNIYGELPVESYYIGKAFGRNVAAVDYNPTAVNAAKNVSGALDSLANWGPFGLGKKGLNHFDRWFAKRMDSIYGKRR